MPLLPNCIFYQ